MTNDTIKTTTKENLRFLQSVFEYKSRTVAVIFVKNTVELIEKWENAQIEVSARYQYQGENSRIWDYYLAICCDFDEASLENTLRFNIENDRFCCRKIFVFNQKEQGFSVDSIIHSLFPQIQSPEQIQILEPSKFIPQLNASASITKDLFIRPLEEIEIENLVSRLIAESGVE